MKKIVKLVQELPQIFKDELQIAARTRETNDKIKQAKELVTLLKRQFVTDGDANDSVNQRIEQLETIIAKLEQ